MALLVFDIDLFAFEHGLANADLASALNDAHLSANAVRAANFDFFFNYSLADAKNFCFDFISNFLVFERCLTLNFEDFLDLLLSSIQDVDALNVD